MVLHRYQASWRHKFVHQFESCCIFSQQSCHKVFGMLFPPSQAVCGWPNTWSYLSERCVQVAGSLHHFQLSLHRVPAKSKHQSICSDVITLGAVVSLPMQTQVSLDHKSCNLYLRYRWHPPVQQHHWIFQPLAELDNMRQERKTKGEDSTYSPNHLMPTQACTFHRCMGKLQGRVKCSEQPISSWNSLLWKVLFAISTGTKQCHDK